MRDKFRNNKDEFYFNENAPKAEELLSAEARVKYDRVKEQVSAMHTIVESILQVIYVICYGYSVAIPPK